MPSFLETETWGQPQWAVCTLKSILSLGLLMDPHSTSQALVMSNLVSTAHLWVKTGKAAFLNV